MNNPIINELMIILIESFINFFPLVIYPILWATIKTIAKIINSVINVLKLAAIKLNLGINIKLRIIFTIIPIKVILVKNTCLFVDWNSWTKAEFANVKTVAHISIWSAGADSTKACPKIKIIILFAKMVMPTPIGIPIKYHIFKIFFHY